MWKLLSVSSGGVPRIVVSTAAFHARVRGSFPGLGGLKETKMFLPHPLLKLSIMGSLRDREVTYWASDLQGSNLESSVWRAVSSHLSHHPQEVPLAKFSLYVHKSGLKPDSFHFFFSVTSFFFCNSPFLLLWSSLNLSRIFKHFFHPFNPRGYISTHKSHNIFCNANLPYCNEPNYVMA